MRAPWWRMVVGGSHVDQSIERASSELGGKLDLLVERLEQVVAGAESRFAREDDDDSDGGTDANQH